MDNKQDFTRGNILIKMIRFMVPILGALILQAMYGAVDLLIVGQFGTTAGISGVSTGSNIINMVTFTISGLAMGVTVLIGRYLGEGRGERVGRVIGGVISFFLMLAAVMTVVLLVFARPVAVLMQAPAEALDLTVLYIRICGGGIVFVIAYNVISSIFRGIGNSRLPLLFVAIACVVNIIGDLVLVAGLHMNVAGAAIATIAAQAVSVVLSLVIIRRQELPFTLTMQDIGSAGEEKTFLILGAPLALQELLTNLAFLALCAFINRIGLEASSGYGIGQKVQSFVMLIPSSIMQSMSSFVAQNVGAGKEDRAKQAMKCGIGIGAGVGVFVFCLIFFKGGAISSLFTDNEAVILRAAEFLRGFAPEAVVTSILFSFYGYFNGHSRSFFVMVQGLAQSLLIRLPMSYLTSIQPDVSLTWVGLAAPTSTVFGIMLCLIYYYKMNREKQNGSEKRIKDPE
ncbi:MAG: MATE family efflux transporter [Clostridiales bacterium]|nr:MATE family efflux transporter [Clostridiales bacterium]